MAAPNFVFIRNMDGSNNPPAIAYVPVAASQTLVVGDAVQLSSGQIIKGNNGFGSCTGVMAQASTTQAANTLVAVFVTKKSQLWNAVASADATNYILVSNAYDLTSGQTVNVADTTGGSIQIFSLYGSTTSILIQFTVNDLG